MSENRKISRREFLKLAAVTMGGLGGLSKREGKFIGENLEKPRINQKAGLMVAKITLALVRAENSGVEDEIRSARKSLLMWIIAQSIIENADQMGYSTAGRTLEHYLYGEGQRLDISDELEKVGANQSESLSKYLMSGVYNMLRQIGSEDYKIGGVEFWKGLKLVIEEMGTDNGYSFTGISSPEGDEDFDYAVGRSYLTLRAVNASAYKTDEQLTVDLEYPTLTLFDLYDWESKSGPLDYEDMASQFSEELLKELFPERNQLKELLSLLGISGMIMDLVLKNYDHFSKETVQNAGTETYFGIKKLVKFFIGDPKLSQEDFSLLEKFGAKPYKITGRAYFGDKVQLVFPKEEF